MVDKFLLKFLWLDKFIAVSLDQKIGNNSTPLTEYFFWPKTDAWEQLRLELGKRSWITQTETILLLNEVTDVINFWQEKSDINRRKELKVAKEKFPESFFVGRD